MGQKCKLAKASFDGTTYFAWYSLELKYPFAPNKLGGVPGIVLDLSDEKKEVMHIIAIDIKLSNNTFFSNKVTLSNCNKIISDKIFKEILQKEIDEHNEKVMELIKNDEQ